MKRIFELTKAEVMAMDAHTLKETIRKSEGRTLMTETVVSKRAGVEDVTEAEVSAAFGSDMIMLNLFDFQEPYIYGLDPIIVPSTMQKTRGLIEGWKKQFEESIQRSDHLRRLKEYTGRFVGANLEPIPAEVDYPAGQKASKENFKRALEMGADFLSITGNPLTSITIDGIVRAVEEMKNTVGDRMLIIAGKMHGAGSGNVYDLKQIERIIDAGADVLLSGAPGCIPGYTVEFVRDMFMMAQSKGALTLSCIGTSQESSPTRHIKDFAIMSKMAGADIIHLGDAGVGHMAPPLNALEISLAIRGERHTYRRMALRR